MTSPYHGEDIGKSTNAVNFHGYAHKPNQQVTIQARRTINDNWTTIAVTSSKTSVVYYDGSTMYPWMIKKVVPGTLWQHHAIGTENSGIHEHRTTLRYGRRSARHETILWRSKRIQQTSESRVADNAIATPSDRVWLRVPVSFQIPMDGVEPVNAEPFNIRRRIFWQLIVRPNEKIPMQEAWFEVPVFHKT